MNTKLLKKKNSNINTVHNSMHLVMIEIRLFVTFEIRSNDDSYFVHYLCTSITCLNFNNTFSMLLPLVHSIYYVNLQFVKQHLPIHKINTEKEKQNKWLC